MRLETAHVQREMEDAKALVELIPQLSSEDLTELWIRYVGKEPRSVLRPEMMRGILAYRIQELESGQLVPETPDPSLHVPLKQLSRAGTRLVREWKGEIHEVVSSPQGYIYRGEIFKNLSPIANRITGSRWSGPVFFGTKKKEVKK